MKNIQSDNKNASKKTYSQYIREYCETSSLQGLSILTQDVSLFEKCWWIFVLLALVAGCTIMIFQVADKWINFPIMVSLGMKELSVSKIPFPAITICPEAKISKWCVDYPNVLRARIANNSDSVSFLQNMYFDYMSLMCLPENHKQMLDTFSLNDYPDFLQNCKVIDIERNAYCEWMNKRVKCEDILQPIITDEGLCYSFNMFNLSDIYSDSNAKDNVISSLKLPEVTWDMEKGYANDLARNTYPKRVFSTGTSNSLLVAFFTNKSDIFTSCVDFTVQGMRVSLHMPSRIPRPSELFFQVGFNKITSAGILPTVTATNDEAIKSYDPQKRYCFFSDERKLKYFKIYTQSNCNLECLTNYTINTCGCVQYFMPRDQSTSICSLSKRKCLDEAKLSFPTSILRRKMDQVKENETVQECNCLPICNDITYGAEVSTGTWNWENEYLVQEGFQKFSPDDYWASALNIYFKSAYFLPVEKSQLYGTLSFLANTGGIIGLFAGFSLFSLLEIIYFLVIKVIVNFR